MMLAPAGSSPRMRGTHRRKVDLFEVAGIIPAYAGNTSKSRCRLLAVRDHPRVCGEHMDARGYLFPGRWIIPAYAGNTPVAHRFRQPAWDHPRVCGEHPERSMGACRDQGSSPRMRGTPRRQRWPVVEFGIIPAYAGNTVSTSMTYTVLSDHPRVCGEHSRLAKLVIIGAGSSPRMRGTPPI